MSDSTVAKYAALMGEGVEFPPIIVERGTGRLFDGMHRYRASGDAGVELKVEEHDVPEGSTAIAYAALLNQGHGLPMRDSDLKSIAEALFDDGARIADIARHIGESRQRVEYWLARKIERRREDEQRLRDVRNIGFALLSAAGWTQQRIADHHEVSQQSVAKALTTDAKSGIGSKASLVWEAVATYAPIEPAVSDIATQWLNPSKPHVANNSGENEWYTPPEYIAAAHAVYEAYQSTCEECEMGCTGDGCTALDLDPASSAIANQTVYAKRIYTAEDDGLAQEWHGTVWMNPPYAQPLIGQFVDKLVDEVDAGRTRVAIVLVNNGTETAWGQKLLSRASAACFPSGRIKFLDPEGNPGAPLQGQMIALIACEQLIAEEKVDGMVVGDAFAMHFAQFGTVLRG